MLTLMLGAALLGHVAEAASSAESQLLARLNDLRAQGVTCPGSGARPVAGALQASELHGLSALKQARYMAQSGVVGHSGQGGSTPRLRAASTGIHALSVTEIVYMGSGLDPEAAMQWWLHSPVHCFYMTDARYTTAGASVVRGNRGTAYVMVLTGDPR